ncbi:phosphoribosylpyrophosphate synthetase [Elizabethkingia anophelis]|nr:phosphoribosylpyrophosphate synthetase [Elizabethkingia anophelis]MDV3842079.1 phosphoribosylpyrophosphate synthetase [Elizabethkingia anophelis]
MEYYDNLVEAINGLRKQGYVEDFNLKQDCLECRNGAFKVFHDEFEIDEYHRFEADTDPSESSIIYAISSPRYNLKGVLVNGYGIYSEPVTDEMLAKLK